MLTLSQQKLSLKPYELLDWVQQTQVEAGMKKTERTVPHITGLIYTYVIMKGTIPVGIYSYIPHETIEGIAEVGVRLWGIGFPRRLAVQVITQTLVEFSKGLTCRVYKSNKDIKVLLQRLGFTFYGEYTEHHVDGKKKTVELYKLLPEDFVNATGIKKGGK